MAEIYDLASALPNKLLNEDGSITDLQGNAVTDSIEVYKNKPAIPNKVLNPDGSFSLLSDILSSGGNGTSSTVWEQIESEVGETYLTKERVVGKWVDGRPLYERILYATGLTPENTAYGNVHNLDPALWLWYPTLHIVNATSICYLSDGQCFINTPFYWSGEDYFRCYYYNQIGRFRAEFSSNFTNREVLITFRYAKEDEVV